MKVLRWSFKLARPLWRSFALATLLALATVASGLGLLATSAYLIARAALQPSIADLQVAIVGVRFLGISRGLFRYAERYLSHNVTFQLLAQIRLWFYRQLEPLAPAALEAKGSGDLLARIIDDIETLQFVFLRVLQPPAVAAIGTGLLMAVLITIDAHLAMIWFLLLALAGLGLPLLANRAGRSVQGRLPQRRGQLKDRTVEWIQGMADLVAYDGVAHQLAELERLDGQIIQDQSRLNRLDSWVQAGLSGLGQLAPIAVFWLALPLVERQSLSGVGLAVLVVAALASFELVSPLAAALPALESSLAAGRRLFELVEMEAPVFEPKQPLPTPALSRFDLKIKDLHFGYDREEAPALRGLNLEVGQGQHMALVGPSGAGKSSLVQLLLRFREYEQGSIQLGGVELKGLAADDARQLFSVLSQRSMLFSGSLRHNLSMANPLATVEDCWQALQLAGAADLVRQLPQGLDTPIGEWGWQLSAGQRRRVALARTLLQDRPYLLLDQPTANLDPLAAQTIMKDIQAVARAKTVLAISHRLAGVASFDQIAVMSRGTIVQQGSHESLSRQPGLYRDMWQLQVERWQLELELGVESG